MPTRILIADDHEVARALLKLMIASNRDWQLVAQAADGAEAVEKAKVGCPHLARMNQFRALRLLSLGRATLRRIFRRRNFKPSPAFQDSFDRRHQVAAKASFGNEPAHACFF